MVVYKGNALYIEGHGLKIRKKSRRIQILNNREIIKVIPILWLREMIVIGHGISLSTDILSELTANNIEIILLSANYRPLALISSPALESRIELRQAQVCMSKDKSSFIAREIIKGKIMRQISILNHFGVSSATIMPSLSNFKGTEIEHFMGIEAHAAALYWQRIRETVPPEADFFGRRKRYAKDVINQLLNYGYGILYARAWALATRIGFDYYAGIIHKRGRAKPAFIFDIVEPYRPIIDFAIFDGVARKKFFLASQQASPLDENNKAQLIEIINKVFDEKIIYIDGKQHKRKEIMEIELRELARCIKSDQNCPGLFGANII